MNPHVDTAWIRTKVALIWVNVIIITILIIVFEILLIFNSNLICDISTLIFILMYFRTGKIFHLSKSLSDYIRLQISTPFPKEQNQMLIVAVVVLPKRTIHTRRHALCLKINPFRFCQFFSRISTSPSEHHVTVFRSFCTLQKGGLFVLIDSERLSFGDVFLTKTGITIFICQQHTPLRTASTAD